MVFLLELSINNKKELYIAKNSLYKALENLLFRIGTPEKFDIRTFKKKLSRLNLEDLKEFHKFIKK